MKRQPVTPLMQDQAQGTDPEALERFIAKHGMTPMQFALSKNPSAAAEVAKAFPHLLPPEEKTPGNG